MKKTYQTILSLCVICSLLGGGRITASELRKDDDQDIKIGVVYYKFDDVYITSVRVAFERLVAEYDNVEQITYNSQNQQDLQLEQIDRLIQHQVDVLLVNIVDTEAAVLAADMAAAANIPIIFFNREPDLLVLQQGTQAYFVGTTAAEAGVIQGHLVANLWLNNPQYDRNQNGLLDYVMLVGDFNNPEAEARTEYAITRVEAAGIEVNLIAQEVAYWEYEQAYETMSQWLVDDRDNIEIVFSNNDSMAAGAIAALQEAGFNLSDPADNWIPVFGVDATEEAIDLISREIMAGTVQQDDSAMAEAIFSLAYNAAQGRDLLYQTDYQFDDSGVAIRIPYQAFIVE